MKSLFDNNNNNMIELFPKRGETGFSPNINFLATPMHDVIDRVVHGSDGPAGWVGSRFCRILAGRVGSGQHFGFFSFLLIISWYLNRYESSNTIFGFIDFLRYLVHND